MSFSNSATPLQYKACLCVPVLVYLLIAMWSHIRGTDDLTGDEAYYLFITESIVDDGDVNLANNLPIHGIRSAGWHESQTIERPHGWYSVHHFGLPAVLCPGWGLWGTFGARLTMVVCCGLAAPLLYRVIDHIWQSPGSSLLAAMALALGLPLLNASNQIYGDLFGGVLLLFAVDCAMAGGEGSPRQGWRALLLCADLAFLPWLHMKYAAAALVVLVWYLDATRRWRSLAAAAALACSLALLVCYNAYAFGRLSGPYQEGNPLALEANTFIVFMGLHFDQAQGMFLQQPLLLLGLFGLAPLWQSSRRNCLGWLLTYAAVIVPNSMHTTWYGGYSFAGRFGSSNVLLWAIPLAYGARTIFQRGGRLFPAITALSIVWQTWLACQWLSIGHDLFYQGWRPYPLRGCVWAYNSLYSELLKAYLPYWMPYTRFWRYPANFSVLLLAIGLLACGWCWPRRRTWARRCFSGATLAAVALPLVLTTKAPPAVWTAGEMHGEVGRAEEEVRIAVEARDQRGKLAVAPQFNAAPGHYRVAVNYQAVGTDDYVGLVMLSAGEKLKLLSLLTPGTGETKQDFSMANITPAECGEPCTFFVWYEGRGTLSVASLSVQKTYK